MCRNPNHDEPYPWCYIDEAHTQIDYCDNKCPEAVERNPDLQSAVATLSGGPVGIGDKQEYMVNDLVLKSCRADGFILRPQKPLTATDNYFLFDTAPEIWTADIQVGAATFGVLFVADNEDTISLSPSQLNLNSALSTQVLFWQNYPELVIVQTIAEGSEVSVPACSGDLQFCLYYTSPIATVGATDIVLLGETGKWAPVAGGRIASYTPSDSTVLVEVLGIQGEVVAISFWSSTNGIFTVSCSFSSSGLSSMTIDAMASTCA